MMLRQLLPVLTVLLGLGIESSDCGQYLGRYIGNLQNTSFGVEGSVYAADERRFIVQGFNYDGGAGDAYFWGGTQSTPTAEGIVIPDEQGRFEPLEAYKEKDLELILPSETRIQDLEAFAVWDNQTGVSLGHCPIPLDFEPPEEMTLGPFSSPVKSGPVVIKDSRTLFVPMLEHSCPGGDVQFLVGNTTSPDPDEALELKKEVNSSEIEFRRSRSQSLESFTLTLTEDMPAINLSWLGVRCSVRSNDSLLGYVLFPRTDLNVPPYRFKEEEEKSEASSGVIYYGTSIGPLAETEHGVKGHVFAASEDSLIIRGFNFHGTAPAPHFWAGSTDKPSAKGFMIPNEFDRGERLGEDKDKDIFLKLPKGKSLKDVKWMSVWCNTFDVECGHVLIPQNLRTPKQVTLHSLPTLAHGVRSGPVIIRDERTIIIPRMFYDGEAPDAYFLLGRGRQIRHENAVKLYRNGNNGRIIGRLRGEDVTLTLPHGLSVRDFDWLSVYCIRFREDFGHVFLPRGLNVPPILYNHPAFKSSRSTKSNKFFGKKLGDFHEGIHKVQGTIYAASASKIFIENFSYDGFGQETYFWLGFEATPSSSGFAIPDELDSRSELKAYEGKDILITLPNNGTLTDIKFFSVWSKRIQHSFGHVIFPAPLELPSERSLGPLTTYAHGVSSGDIVIKDPKTLLIKDLHYDGRAPDAFFLVGTGPYPLPNGTKVPDENGKITKIHGYKGQDLTLRLPGSLTVFDIDWFSLYCITYTENFGHVFIPKDLNIPADITELKRKTTPWENCEVIFPDVLQVSWNVEDDNIHIQLQGIAEPNEYLSFGISSDPQISRMVGADVTLVYQRGTAAMATAVDYYLSAKAQCSDGVGACPDVNVGGTDDIILSSSQRKGDLLTVSYRKPLLACEPQDLAVDLAEPIAVVAAIGHIDSRDEAAFHHTHYTKSTTKIHFGRQPTSSDGCKDLEQGRRNARKEPVNLDDEPWTRGAISPDVQVFRASLGPTGGSKGYDAITGHHSWGYAWWINGELIPELQVIRGKNYTFQVEGGSRHPLYVTENSDGGGSQYQEDLGKPGHRVYAGVTKDSTGEYVPIAVGQFCEWKREDFDYDKSSETYEAYKKALKLSCGPGEPAKFTWTPDDDTPDLVYYHCFVHRHFGWKIHVLDQL